MDVKLNAEFKRLFSFGEQFGNDEASQVGYSISLRRWSREFVARDYVLEVTGLSQGRCIKRLVNVDDAAEAIGLAVMVNERIKRAGENFELQSDAWWHEIVYIVDAAIDTKLQPSSCTCRMGEATERGGLHLFPTPVGGKWRLPLGTSRAR